jgi:hypothetical protein
MVVRLANIGKVIRYCRHSKADLKDCKEKIMIEEDAARCRNRKAMAQKAFKLTKQFGKSNLPTAAIVFCFLDNDRYRSYDVN